MSLEVRETGPLSTVQDLGRPGLGGIGVGASGAADRGSLRLANRLVGNPEGAAAVEVTFGGLVVVTRRALTLAVTGARCPLTIGGRGAATNTVLRVPEGTEVRLGRPVHGVRSYLAVRGGIGVEPVLGSRSTDVLAGLGPAIPEAGSVLPVDPPPTTFPTIDAAPVSEVGVGECLLSVVPGPRDDWFEPGALRTLLSESYVVTAESNRVGMRLDGPSLKRSRRQEMLSEGMVPGALQVPPASQPTLFLADHPVTGGYPVLAVVVAADVDRASQVRPGQRVRFQLARGASRKAGI